MENSTRLSSAVERFPKGRRVSVHSDDYNGDGTVIGHKMNSINVPLVLVKPDLEGCDSLKFYVHELTLID